MSAKKPTICPRCKQPITSYVKLDLGAASIVVTEEQADGTKVQQTIHFTGGTREVFGPCRHVVEKRETTL